MCVCVCVRVRVSYAARAVWKASAAERACKSGTQLLGVSHAAEPRATSERQIFEGKGLPFSPTDP